MICNGTCNDERCCHLVSLLHQDRLEHGLYHLHHACNRMLSLLLSTYSYATQDVVCIRKTSGSTVQAANDEEGIAINRRQPGVSKQLPTKHINRLKTLEIMTWHNPRPYLSKSATLCNQTVCQYLNS